jgi:hypothetical protein
METIVPHDGEFTEFRVDYVDHSHDRQQQSARDRLPAALARLCPGKREATYDPRPRARNVKDAASLAD